MSIRERFNKYKAKKSVKNFDYGKKQPDGQYENYPSYPKGKYKAPLRDAYMHEKCGSITYMSDMPDIVETYAKYPGTELYGRTFCVRSRNHFNIHEFFWLEKGNVTNIRMDQVVGVPGLDLRSYNI